MEHQAIISMSEYQEFIEWKAKKRSDDLLEQSRNRKPMTLDDLDIPF